MLKRDPNFTRLKKLGGRGYLNRVSYWLGVDHLLVVDVTYYNERYRRFYFRDLQAVIVQKNRRHFWLNVIFGVVLSFALMPFLFVPRLAIWRWPESDVVSAIVGGIFVILSMYSIIVNSLRGPTCSMHLRTAVQTQKLTGISRWRRAESLIETLAPLILSAQPSAAETSRITPAAALVTFASPVGQPETP